MTDLPNADHFMASGLGDWLARQADLRTKTKETVKSRRWIGFCVGAGFFLFSVILGFSWTACQIAGAIPIILGLVWGEMAARPVINAIKSEMNAYVAKALGMSFSLAGDPNPSFDLAKRFDLLPSHDQSKWEDFWAGELDDLQFTLCELHLQQWQSSGKSRRLETVFRGALARIGFARDFHGITIIERQANKIVEFFEGNQVSRDGIDLSRIRMVDPQFEDVFEIWSTDQVEARYLVHPSYCERLIALEEQFDGQKLRALFHGGAIIIAIETGELFESGSLEADEDRALMNKTIEQFSSLINLARALNERPR
jgi:hypothetical protein